MALIAGMAPGTCNFFLSLEKEIIKMQVVGASRTPSTEGVIIISKGLQ